MAVIGSFQGLLSFANRINPQPVRETNRFLHPRVSLWRSMRHPLLKVLAALFMGILAPLCCCQAMALAGSACGDATVREIRQDTCCQSCKGEPRSTDDGPPTDHERSHPGDCPSCPSCQGTANGAGLRAEARLAAPQLDWNAIATIALAATIAPSWLHEASITGSLSSWGKPPYARANREAQRWHCALNI